MSERPFWYFPVLAAWWVVLVPATVVAPFAIFLAGQDSGGLLRVAAVILWLTVPVTVGGAIAGMLLFQKRDRRVAVRWCAAAPAIHLALLAGVMVLAEVLFGRG